MVFNFNFICGHVASVSFHLNPVMTRHLKANHAVYHATETRGILFLGRRFKLAQVACAISCGNSADPVQIAKLCWVFGAHVGLALHYPLCSIHDIYLTMNVERNLRNL